MEDDVGDRVECTWREAFGRRDEVPAALLTRPVRPPPVPLHCSTISSTACALGVDAIAGDPSRRAPSSIRRRSRRRRSCAVRRSRFSRRARETARPSPCRARVPPPVTRIVLPANRLLANMGVSSFSRLGRRRPSASMATRFGRVREGSCALRKPFQTWFPRKETVSAFGIEVEVCRAPRGS